MPRPSRIGADVDFGQAGRQQGFLRLPYSSHASAYGWLPIPIIVINNGPGPRILLMAGNHGDEYEGQVTLVKLCRELDASQVRGRLILLPAANFPAAQAGLRTSPIDQGNLNRSFPGDPDGDPTRMIAHYIESELLPRVDYVIDLHSGGSSLMYIPTVFSSCHDDPAQMAEILELMRLFNAPISCIGDFPGEDRTLAAAARRTNTMALLTELGGSGTVTPAALRIAERGVRRVLHYLGSAPGFSPAPLDASRPMEVGGDEYYTYSPEAGLWEPLVELGDEVHAGQPAAAVHFPDTPWREPATVAFRRSGLVVCKRVPGRVQRGDCLFHLASDVTAASSDGT